MRAKIGKKPIEKDEIEILGNVANNLYMLATQENLPHCVAEQLRGMYTALKTIWVAHGRKNIKTSIKKDGSLDQWPDGTSEIWEAIK